MGVLGKIAGLFSKDAKGFGFVVDLVWKMLAAQRTKLAGPDKLNLVLQWFAKQFNTLFGEKYEALRAAVIEAIAANKKVINLIQELT